MRTCVTVAAYFKSILVEWIQSVRKVVPEFMFTWIDKTGSHSKKLTPKWTLNPMDIVLGGSYEA